MLVRVYRNPDNSVRVFTPNSSKQRPDEPAADFLARLAAENEQADPTLNGLPFVDTDSEALPSGEQRYAWRLNGRNQVVVDPTVTDPAVEAEEQRLADARLVLNSSIVATATAQEKAALARVLGIQVPGG